jgi:hypothetical protein
VKYSSLVIVAPYCCFFYKKTSAVCTFSAFAFHYLYSPFQMIKVANAILVIMMMMVVGILGQCETPQQFIPNGQTKCQYVDCRNDDHCKDYIKSCSKSTEMFCLYDSKLFRKLCACRGQWSGDRYGNGSCNYKLNVNDKCDKDLVCSKFPCPCNVPLPSGSCFLPSSQRRTFNDQRSSIPLTFWMEKAPDTEI